MVVGGLRDMGFPAFVLRHAKRPFGTLLRVELVWGGLLTLGVWLGAPLIVRLNPKADSHLLIAMLGSLALVIFLEGLAQVPMMKLEGELRHHVALIPELVRYSLFSGIAIALAWRGYGPWSLVIGYGVAALVFTLWLWWQTWGTIDWYHPKGKTLSLYRASLPLGTLWILFLLNQQVDTFILGWRFDDSVLGDYNLAYLLAGLMALVLVPALGRVIFPALSSHVKDEEDAFDIYRLGTLLLLGLEVPAALFLFLNASWVIQLVAGEGRYLEAIPLLRWLCFFPLADPLGRLAAQYFGARHRELFWTAAASTTLVSFLGFGLLLTKHFGPMGMAWANFLPLGALVTAWGIHRLVPGRLGGLLRDIVQVYCLGALPFIPLFFLKPAPLHLVLLSFGAAIVAALLLLWRFGGDYRTLKT